MRRADGDAILRIIGIDPAAAGIIETGALPATIATIAAIERALAQEKPRHAPTLETSGPEQVAADAGVSLSQRARPVPQMLRSARLSSAAVTWSA